jgi:hypothetical protein
MTNDAHFLPVGILPGSVQPRGCPTGSCTIAVLTKDGKIVSITQAGLVLRSTQPISPLCFGSNKSKNHAERHYIMVKKTREKLAE